MKKLILSVFIIYFGLGGVSYAVDIGPMCFQLTNWDESMSFNAQFNLTIDPDAVLDSLAYRHFLWGYVDNEYPLAGTMAHQFNVRRYFISYSDGSDTYFIEIQHWLDDDSYKGQWLRATGGTDGTWLTVERIGCN